MRRSLGASQAGILLAVCGMASAPAFGQVLFREDFESFPLFQNQDEGVDTGPTRCEELAFIGDGVLCGQQNTENPGCGPDTIDCASVGFTNTPFDGNWAFGGWTMEFSPAGVGTLEWQGFTVASNEFWWESDDQRRTEFINSSGNILVADPDEWDDFDPFVDDPESVGPYDTTATSPAFDVTGVDADSITVRFDSSWRPETDFRNQQARMSVRFDGGAWEEYLYWNSDENDANYKADAPNETLDILIDNPQGASTMEVQFEMFDAANDWWWAIDDVVVFTGDAPVDPPQDFQLLIDTFNDDRTPDFAWTESVNALNYSVLISNDPDFVDIVVDDDTTDLMYTPAVGALQAGIYYVRVIAENDLGTNSQDTIIGVDNTCPADLTGDGNANTQDVLLFLNLWTGGC